MECSFCGREVRKTIHRRDAARPYEVDYYRLLTGKLQRIAVQTVSDEDEVVEYFKLTEPRFVTCCADCSQKQEVRDELDRLFAGVPEETEAGTG